MFIEYLTTASKQSQSRTGTNRFKISIELEMSNIKVFHHFVLVFWCMLRVRFTALQFELAISIYILFLPLPCGCISFPRTFLRTDLVLQHETDTWAGGVITVIPMAMYYQ